MLPLILASLARCSLALAKSVLLMLDQLIPQLAPSKSGLLDASAVLQVNIHCIFILVAHIYVCARGDV